MYARLSRRISRIARQNPEAEFKVDAGQITAAQMTNAGTVYYLAGMPQGVTGNDRIGLQTYLRSLQLRMGISKVPTTGPTAFIRIIIGIDRNPDGRALTPAEILLPLAIVGMTNWVERGRFVVLADKTFQLSDPDHNNLFLKWYRRFRLRQIYSGATAAVTDMTTNQPFLMTFSDQPGGANAPLITFYNKVTFQDA